MDKREYEVTYELKQYDERLAKQSKQTKKKRGLWFEGPVEMADIRGEFADWFEASHTATDKYVIIKIRDVTDVPITLEVSDVNVQSGSEIG